jgi:hypothetical protein
VLLRKEQEIPEVVLRSYVELLKLKFQNDFLVFSEKDLELNQFEWQKFIEDLCRLSSDPKILFICNLGKDENTCLYFINSHVLNAINFTSSSYLNPFNQKSMYYAQRV